MKLRPSRAVPALLAVGALAITGLAPIDAHALPERHNPTHHQLAESQSLVARRLAEVRRIEQKVATARVAQTKASTAAEIASESYDAAHLKLTTAQQSVHADQVTLDAATRSVDRQNHGIARFARLAYQSGGLSSLQVVIDPSGTQSVVNRLENMQAIAHSQDIALQKLQADRIVQASVARQAQQAETVAAAAAATAQRDFNAAKSEAATAQREYDAVVRDKNHLATLLADAKANASRLQREHIAAVAAAAAARARRIAAESAPPPANSHGSPYTGSTGSLGGTVSAATELEAVHEAESQIGKPYVWAAAGPDSYDCSGLTMWAYAQVGVTLDHYTGDQWQEGAHVSISQLRPGDLVFFATDTADPATIHHVGMYIGNGMMVDAPYTGVDVRTEPATDRPDYIGAVRPYQT